MVNLEEYMSKICKTSDFLRKNLTKSADFLIIIGSGLGDLANLLKKPINIKYSEIPNFPVSTVKGHSGELLYGILNNKKVIIMKGRFHLYEGYHPWEVVFPIRVLKQLGIRGLIITNAAGGINPNYEVGDIMIIRDHINFMFRNPLIGPTNEFLGDRFPDMCNAYDKKWRKLIREIGIELGYYLKEGVYLASLGPNYETKAEIEMMRKLGADAVGMSTVPEVLAAVNMKLKILGLSFISNVHKIGIEYHTTHSEVLENSRLVSQKMINLIDRFLKKV